jgi:glutaminyl-tRNA synthetase
MYAYAHPIEDALENITHSICTLEFEDQRPWYDWLLDTLCELGLLAQPRPHQYEFARLNVTYVITSKRKLKALVDENIVAGWDDPRMPTIAGLRRRGFPADAIRRFATEIGVSKRDAVIEIEQLEHVVRDALNLRALRRFAVLRPLKVVIEDYPEGQVEMLEAVDNPEDPGAGSRQVPFGRELWIERDDFMEDPPPKFYRLAPGREVRLRYAYFITCREVVRDAAGKVVELRCTYDPATRGGDAPDGRRPKATLHWVSASHAVPAEVRLYERLFTRPDPGADGDLLADLDPASEEILTGCYLEPAAARVAVGETVQFERLGYFCADPDSTPERPVFDRTLTLKDSWAKVQARAKT